jgi:hypothetical protein
MKKNIITAGIIAVIAIVAFLNVNVASKSEKSNSLVDITLTNVETLAYSESGWSQVLEAMFKAAGGVTIDGVKYIFKTGAGWVKATAAVVTNIFQGEGATKDERQEKRPCPTYQSGNGGGGATVDTPSGGGSAQGNGSYEQINPSDREEYICLYGATNCKTAPC